MGFILHFKVVLLVIVIMLLQSCSKDVKDMKQTVESAPQQEVVSEEAGSEASVGVFTDKQFALKIKEIFELSDLSEEELFKKGVFESTKLNLSNTGLDDLSDIKLFPKLKNLNLSNNSIVDLEPLSSLKSVTTLNLRGNLLADISVLSELKSLKNLNLSKNSIEEVSSLSMLSLRSLNIAYNNIYDLSGIYALNKLKHINVSGLPYEIDLAELTVLSSLKSIVMNETSAVNEKGLFAFKNLKTLKCNRMKNFDFSALSSIKLEELSLVGNDLIDISFLQGNFNIKNLSLKRNRLDKDSITVLSSLISLESIDLSHNFISGDLNFKSHDFLTKLVLANNALRNLVIVGFSAKANIEVLNIAGNDIKSLRVIGLTDSSRKLLEELIPSMEKSVISNEIFALSH